MGRGDGYRCGKGREKRGERGLVCWVECWEKGRLMYEFFGLVVLGIGEVDGVRGEVFCRRLHVTVLWYNLDIIVATILLLLEDVDHLEHFEIYNIFQSLGN